MKECTNCTTSYPHTGEYFYKSSNKNEEFSSWCKECQKDKSRKSYRNNKEKSNKRGKEHYRKNKEIYNQMNREWNRNNKEKLSRIAKVWRENNKDKLKEYGQKYKNKKHKITIKQWELCRDYFDYQCAYCGMSEAEHKQKNKQQLHKEHVIHEGRSDIKNCVPSCRSCNSSKRASTINQWYSINNPIYNRERYLKIYQWIRFDCKKLSKN